MASHIQPLSLIENSIGNRMRVLMKDEKEIVGTLVGFDEFVNIVMEDVIEYSGNSDGKKETKLDQILLNGNNACMFIPILE